MYEILPLLTTTGPLPFSAFCYLSPLETTIYPFYGPFLLRSDEHTFLVDTGISGEDYTAITSMPHAADHDIVALLNREGHVPSDIEKIFFTHLHFDHVANISRFPDAEKIVQAAELRFALNTNAYLNSFYTLQFIQDVKFTQIHGDADAGDGISLLHLPGHTPGCQAVCVPTPEGITAISGFCCTGDNFSGETLVIPSIHEDVEQTYASLKRLVASVDNIYPNHSSTPVCCKKTPHR